MVKLVSLDNVKVKMQDGKWMKVIRGQEIEADERDANVLLATNCFSAIEEPQVQEAENTETENTEKKHTSKRKR